MIGARELRVTMRAIPLILLLGTGLPVGTALAQSYPDRPVKIIVPTPPGGPVDVIARITANYLQNALGKGVVVENRAGAGNTIGSKDAAEAAPDGYTLLYSSSSGLVIAPLLHADAGYDPLKSFDAIALVGESSNILVVNPSVPANSVQELVAYAKANPGKVNFSSGGIGVLPHLIGEMFKARAGIDIVHVPYKGGAPSINDLVAGNVQMTFEGTSVLLPLIQAGRLRALAVTTPKRIPQLPDVPTMVESGFADFVSTSWTGLLAPAHTPQPIVEKLNAAINAGLQTPELKTALERLSNVPLGGTPADFTNVIKADLAKWSPIVKALGLDKP
ncbi:MAG TPA: tripartite tricarboxylate transporter substrate binding protein [Xanthobacteraceae bacterium]|jgi:tripartite-type tricarboxylate transporter receptor subunit TctC|nr:tripartite tricarboxylate transporter substrate binding protein [Xanthobacteraceae bacterium]